VVPKGARFWFRLLAAAKQGVVQHNGESVKPRGAQGDPIKVATKAAERAKEGQPPGGGPMSEELQTPRQKPSLHVLLAEDDSAIRELTELLLARQGHKVVAVDNGQDALRTLSTRSFDVVLLDDEMPGLSGAETARRIRAGEKGGSKHQFILSLSGNNTEADKRRLMDAGVDACLSKPFHAEELNQALTRFALSSVPAATSPAKPGAVNDFDAELLARVGGDAKLLQRMIKIFLKDYPKKLALLRKALAQKDAAAIAATAHVLKGSVSIFGAAGARRCAEELQEMGRAGQLSGAAMPLAQLEEEIANLEKKLRGYKREASRTGSPSGKGKAGVRRRQKRARR
jgi:protein-histidine pros-kinase